MAPLVLVVSRNPGLAMTLGSESFEVASLRPGELAGWSADETGRPDAVLLDVEHAQDALDTLTSMRANGNLAPVLILSGENEEWRAAEWLELPGARILTLPISRAAILLALDDALREPDVHAPDLPSAAPVPDAPAVGPEAAEVGPSERPKAPQVRLHDVLDDTADEGFDDVPFPEIPLPLAGVTRSEPPTPASLSRRPTSTDLAERRTAQGQDKPLPRETTPRRVAQTTPHPVPAFRGEPRTVPDSGAHQAPEPDQERDVEPAPVVTVPATPDEVPVDVDAAPHLVSLLLARVDQLMTLRETADIVCSDLVQRIAADAAVLLLPDGDRWRVAGGVGLRVIENRFELAANSWLVEQVALKGKGAIIEDTDVARAHLAGAPLASHRNLVAAPMAPDGVLLVARADDPPFRTEDLQVLASVGREAAGYLRAATDLRRLARALEEHRDVR